MIRTEAPKKDNTNYLWGASTEGQCTWYCYYRAFEELKSYPTWWDKETKTGKYPNAKNWVNENREPWVVMDKNYQPQEHDIIVWNGNYGHVAFVEKNNGDGTCLISQYNLDSKEGFSNATWNIGSSLVGKYARTGALKGYLHYPTTEPEVDYKTKYEYAVRALQEIGKVAKEYE